MCGRCTAGTSADTLHGYVCVGLALVQQKCRQSHTAEVGFRSEPGGCGICGAWRSNGTRLIPRAAVTPCQYYSSNAPCSTYLQMPSALCSVWRLQNRIRLKIPTFMSVWLPYDWVWYTYNDFFNFCKNSLYTFFHLHQPNVLFTLLLFQHLCL